MMENTNQTNYEDLFVDTADNVAEKVTDSNDFYDDDDFIDTNDTVSELFNTSVVEPQQEVNSEMSIPVNNFSFEDIVDEEVEEQPMTKLEFSDDSDMPIETEIVNETEEPEETVDELIALDDPIELEELVSFEEPIDEEIEEKVEEPVIEEEIFVEEEPVVEEESVSDETVEFDPFELSNLTNDDMDKMIEEDTKKEELDDSYVLSNFDVLFDSLYNDVNGANNFISNLIEQKKNVNSNEASLKEEEEKLLKEKAEFAKYMEIQKESIEAEKAQCKEFVRTQKNRIQNEEEKFNNDMEAARAERKLAEKALKIEEQKLDEAKDQFEKYKEVEEAKLKSDREKLEAERQQFEKEKEIELEKIKNDKKELQSQKDQFARTKELEEKKLELESKNLSQSCARFKELVSQFNSGFQQLPEDK
ncbi:MAG: hypothetical protein E7157_02680 [Lactobacillales bacterium]|nr:hypothetical protein [Lactobacillales bacterium]